MRIRDGGRGVVERGAPAENSKQDRGDVVAQEVIRHSQGG